MSARLYQNYDGKAVPTVAQRNAKPDDIPQDIWDAAHEVGNLIPGGEGDAVTVCVGDIARAIMAEREACAFTAERHGQVVSNEPIGQACSRNIAAAIRNRSPA